MPPLFAQAARAAAAAAARGRSKTMFHHAADEKPGFLPALTKVRLCA